MFNSVQNKQIGVHTEPVCTNFKLLKVHNFAKIHASGPEARLCDFQPTNCVIWEYHFNWRHYLNYVRQLTSLMSDSAHI